MREERTIEGIGQIKGEGRMTVVNVEAPSPRAGEILVDVQAAGLNEMDVEIREGGWSRYVKSYRKRGSALTGFEFAGIARSSGRRIKEGQRVIGYVHITNGPRTHAQAISVGEDCLHEIPDDLDFEDAAAVLAMGLAAIDVFERLKPLRRNDRVLIVGAAGGLGIYSLQLAKSQGALVTAICSEKNRDWIKSQGADEVRAYEHESALTDGDEFDLILDVAQKLSFSRARCALSRSGMYVTTNPFKDLWGFVRAFGSARKAGFMLVLETKPEKLARLIELVATGVLKPMIDSRFGMAEINEAMDRFARSGKQGRILIGFGPSDSSRGGEAKGGGQGR